MGVASRMCCWGDPGFEDSSGISCRRDLVFEIEASFFQVGLTHSSAREICFFMYIQVAVPLWLLPLRFPDDYHSA